MSVVVPLISVLAAGHPLVAHAVGAFAVEVLPGGLFGLRLGGVEGGHGGGLGGLFGPARRGQHQQRRAQEKPAEALLREGFGRGESQHAEGVAPFRIPRIP